MSQYEEDEFEDCENNHIQVMEPQTQIHYPTFEDNDSLSISQKLTVTSNRKKRASNDAQLLLNRIALLKKEEEKAKKRILKTKEKALEVLLIREEQESRCNDQSRVEESEKYQTQEIHDKNLIAENQLRRSTVLKSEEVRRRKKQGAQGIKSEKQQIAYQIQQEQNAAFLLKKKKRDEVRRMEALARQRRENEKREYDRKLKEEYLIKVAREETEAIEAERIVKELERQEAEYIKKLQIVQKNQDEILNTLENLILSTTPSPLTSPTHIQRKASSPKVPRSSSSNSTNRTNRLQQQQFTRSSYDK